LTYPEVAPALSMIGPIDADGQGENGAPFAAMFVARKHKAKVAIPRGELAPLG